ncbi:hypothetical protein J1614_007149 [Plenodomus biglobosus]|nr:hypothetical protein J1614_007149 [Plenodomus biglobosus]
MGDVGGVCIVLRLWRAGCLGSPMVSGVRDVLEWNEWRWVRLNEKCAKANDAMEPWKLRALRSQPITTTVFSTICESTRYSSRNVRYSLSQSIELIILGEFWLRSESRPCYFTCKHGILAQWMDTLADTYAPVTQHHAD